MSKHWLKQRFGDIPLSQLCPAFTGERKSRIRPARTGTWTNLWKIKEKWDKGQGNFYQTRRTIVFLSPHLRTFNSVVFSTLSSLANARRGKQSSLSLLVSGDPARGSLAPTPTAQASHLLPAPSPTACWLSRDQGPVAPLDSWSEPVSSVPLYKGQSPLFNK